VKNGVLRGHYYVRLHKLLFIHTVGLHERVLSVGLFGIVLFRGVLLFFSFLNYRYFRFRLYWHYRSLIIILLVFFGIDCMPVQVLDSARVLPVQVLQMLFVRIVHYKCSYFLYMSIQGLLFFL
jgi:hypothetical protein